MSEPNLWFWSREQENNVKNVVINRKIKLSYSYPSEWMMDILGRDIW